VTFVREKEALAEAFEAKKLTLDERDNLDDHMINKRKGKLIQRVPVTQIDGFDFSSIMNKLNKR